MVVKNIKKNYSYCERRNVMDLGEKIRKMRKEKNLSQEQLAEKLDVSRQTISNWENGKFYPDIDSLVNLSKVKKKLQSAR